MKSSQVAMVIMGLVALGLFFDASQAVNGDVKIALNIFGVMFSSFSVLSALQWKLDTKELST